MRGVFVSNILADGPAVATVVALRANPAGIICFTGFSAVLAGDRRQPLRELDVLVYGLVARAVEAQRAELLFHLLDRKSCMRPINERFETQALKFRAPAAMVVKAERRKGSPRQSCQPIPRCLFRDGPAIGIFLRAGAFLLARVLANGRQSVDEFIPPSEESFFEEIAALPGPRIAEFFLDSQTELPDDFKPAVAVIESPAHAGLGHWGIVILVKHGEALQQFLGQFGIHRCLIDDRSRVVPLLWSMWNEERFVSVEAEWEGRGGKGSASNDA